jgi:hypothetical protein
MRAGFALAPIKETEPTEDEQVLMGAVIRDLYITAVGQWLIRQKPKIRANFIKFLDTVYQHELPEEYNTFCSDVAERFARDIIQPDFHSVLRLVIDASDGEFADVLHMLSLHMQRTNVMAAVQGVRDRVPQLIKEIAEEDHVYSRPHVAHHELPTAVVAMELSRGRMADPLPRIPRTRSCKPAPADQMSPFAMFPTGEKMESMTRSQFVNHKVREKAEQSGVWHVLNAPTCL